jgi:hypothetical protein
VSAADLAGGGVMDAEAFTSSQVLDCTCFTCFTCFTSDKSIGSGGVMDAEALRSSQVLALLALLALLDLLALLVQKYECCLPRRSRAAA